MVLFEFFYKHFYKIKIRRKNEIFFIKLKLIYK